LGNGNTYAKRNRRNGEYGTDHWMVSLSMARRLNRSKGIFARVSSAARI
jgi:hypothetical protein